jgi:hypothetical protein
MSEYLSELSKIIEPQAMLTFTTNWKNRNSETAKRDILKSIKFWEAQISKKVIGNRWLKPEYKNLRMKLQLVLEHTSSNIHAHALCHRPKKKDLSYPSWDELKAICPWKETVVPSGDVDWKIFADLSEEHTEKLLVYPFKSLAGAWQSDKIIYNPDYDS